MTVLLRFIDHTPDFCLKQISFSTGYIFYFKGLSTILSKCSDNLNISVLKTGNILPPNGEGSNSAPGGGNDLVSGVDLETQTDQQLLALLIELVRKSFHLHAMIFNNYISDTKCMILRNICKSGELIIQTFSLNGRPKCEVLNQEYKYT